MRDAIIIQQTFSSGEFGEMQRLTLMRHTAYARSREMDYWAILGDYPKEIFFGSWGKIKLVLNALEQGYRHVFWVDADAAIMDFSTDLRDALKDGGKIGACLHDAPHFPSMGIAPHLNVGVLYFKNADITRQFCADWLSRYPGDRRWMEQGAFNDMVKEAEYKELVVTLPDKWNATIDVNMCPNPVIKGWHGIMPWARRTEMMRMDLTDDFRKFRP